MSLLTQSKNIPIAIGQVFLIFFTKISHIPIPIILLQLVLLAITPALPYLFSLFFFRSDQPLSTSNQGILNDSTRALENGSSIPSSTLTNNFSSAFLEDVNHTTSTTPTIGLLTHEVNGYLNSSDTEIFTDVQDYDPLTVSEIPVPDTFTEVQEYDTNTVTETPVPDTFTKVQDYDTKNESKTPMSDTFATNKAVSTTLEEYPGQCDEGWVGYRQFCYKVGFLLKWVEEIKSISIS